MIRYCLSPTLEHPFYTRGVQELDFDQIFAYSLLVVSSFIFMRVVSEITLRGCKKLVSTSHNHNQILHQISQDHLRLDPYSARFFWEIPQLHLWYMRYASKRPWNEHAIGARPSHGKWCGYAHPDAASQIPFAVAEWWHPLWQWYVVQDLKTQVGAMYTFRLRTIRSPKKIKSICRRR